VAHNRDTAEAKASGWQVTGDPDKWELLCKASNMDTGEYHSTKVLTLEDGQCVICVDTRTPEGQFVRSMVVAPAKPA